MSKENVRYISVTDTAKLIRADLKKAYPAVKFSVKSSKYAGGASVSVRWTDGPTQRTVNALVHKYAGKTIDNILDDSWKYVESELKNPDGTVEKVQYGSHHVFTSREISDLEKKVEAVRVLVRAAATLSEDEESNFAYRVVRSKEETETYTDAILRVLEQPQTSA